MEKKQNEKKDNKPFIVKTLANFTQAVTENLYEKADKEDKKRILNMKYLYFKKGDKIKVLQAPAHGWWHGKLLRNYSDMFDQADSR